jgi:hypothetical protein
MTRPSIQQRENILRFNYSGRNAEKLQRLCAVTVLRQLDTQDCGRAK